MNHDTEQWTVSKSATRHADGMVSAQHILAARAGAAMLEQGGNAVDAAVAAGLALGAVEPWMCGLGGSGLMVIWLAAEKRAVTLDFQGVLAEATSFADYPVDPDLPQTLMGFPTVRDNANVEGYRAITVPGAAAGFDHALYKWGSLPRATVAEPAIALARNGVEATWFTTLQIALASPVLSRDPASRDIYLPGGHPLAPETPMVIPGLADTLARYSAGGAAEFYDGTLAQDIVADLVAGGALISTEDFARYEVLEATAHTHDHRGATAHVMGDVSGGTRLRDFLAYSARHMPTPPDRPTPETWRHYANGLNAAFRAHNARIGRATETGSCTSHLSAADRHGNMVALTHTLLNRFGSGVTLPRTGLLMNNAVSYFDPRPDWPTSMAPTKRINASNMCPAVVTRDEQPAFALGASGGNHIMPAVAQVAALMLDFGMSLEEAMNHPRIDASDRASVRADPALGQAVIDALARDHDLEIAQRLVFPKLYACVSAVAAEAGGWSGLNDPSQPSGGSSGPAPLSVSRADPSHQDVRA
ncbi:MAG: gamma-glutamyltransferase [Rhodobacteraceae bacterium]|nr:gamma-glutamyltransferase [Paracoccaceae bacterium]